MNRSSCHLIGKDLSSEGASPIAAASDPPPFALMSMTWNSVRSACPRKTYNSQLGCYKRGNRNHLCKALFHRAVVLDAARLGGRTVPQPQSLRRRLSAAGILAVLKAILVRKATEVPALPDAFVVARGGHPSACVLA